MGDVNKLASEIDAALATFLKAALKPVTDQLDGLKAENAAMRTQIERMNGQLLQLLQRSNNADPQCELPLILEGPIGPLAGAHKTGSSARNGSFTSRLRKRRSGR